MKQRVPPAVVPLAGHCARRFMKRVLRPQDTQRCSSRVGLPARVGPTTWTWLVCGASDLNIDKEVVEKRERM